MFLPHRPLVHPIGILLLKSEDPETKGKRRGGQKREAERERDGGRWRGKCRKKRERCKTGGNMYVERVEIELGLTRGNTQEGLMCFI